MNKQTTTETIIITTTNNNRQTTATTATVNNKIQVNEQTNHNRNNNTNNSKQWFSDFSWFCLIFWSYDIICLGKSYFLNFFSDFFLIFPLGSAQIWADAMPECKLLHFEHNGELMCLLLNIVEVAKSHSGTNLAAAFVEILADFGISDKVSARSFKWKYRLTTLHTRFSVLHAIIQHQTMWWLMYLLS